MSLNTWVANGRLTKDSELRYTPNGTAVLNFTMAVKRNFKNEAGDYEADFINCVMWGERSEKISDYLRQGTLIGIKARLQSRSYENQDGFKVYVTEAVVEEVDLLAQPQDKTPEPEPQQNKRNNGSSSNQGNNRNQRTNNRNPR